MDNVQVAMATQRLSAFTRKVPTIITGTTPAPASRAQAAKYLDSRQWAEAIDQELVKIDERGTIRWIPTDQKPPTKPIPLTLSFNYKRDENESIEERKARDSIRADIMQPNVYFYPKCTSATMVDRVAVGMVLTHSVQQGWELKRMDIHNAFINERHKSSEPVYIREPPRAGGPLKHGGTTFILEFNLYGNPSGTYYYLEKSFGHMKRRGLRHNAHNVCLVKLVTKSDALIASIAVDDFLVAASTQAAMGEFFEFLNANFRVKGLGRPKMYLGWYFYYSDNGDVGLSQRLLRPYTSGGQYDTQKLQTNSLR